MSLLARRPKKLSISGANKASGPKPLPPQAVLSGLESPHKTPRSGRRLSTGDGEVFTGTIFQADGPKVESQTQKTLAALVRAKHTHAGSGRSTPVCVFVFVFLSVCDFFVVVSVDS